MNPVSLIQQSEDVVISFLHSPASHEPIQDIKSAWVALNDVTKQTHLSEAAVGGRDAVADVADGVLLPRHEGDR